MNIAPTYQALEALVERESARRLAAVAGSQADLQPVLRRRSAAWFSWIHLWVIGELACENLRDRSRVLALLVVDAQLFASAKLSHCTLRTQDRYFAYLAQAFGISPA